MDFPKGYKGPGWDLEKEVKKQSLKRLKKTMCDMSAQKVAARQQKKEQNASKFVSSVEPTYPGFKGNT